MSAATVLAASILINHWTPDAIGITPFTPALQH